MDAFWKTIDSQPTDDSYEKLVDLLGELNFSPKDRVGEIDLEKIEIDDLKRLLAEVNDMPTVEDEELYSDLNGAHMTVLNEAFIRRGASHNAWISAKKQVKKNFF